MAVLRIVLIDNLVLASGRRAGAGNEQGHIGAQGLCCGENLARADKPGSSEGRTIEPGRPGFLKSERGLAIVWVALLSAAMVAVMGLAAEVSYWFLLKRSMQNACDAAAIAAATNHNTVSDSGQPPLPYYLREAYNVAAQYGFVDGKANTTVSGTNTSQCPDGSGATCYQVSISRTVPLYLVGVIGFKGNAMLGGSRAQKIVSTAIAGPGPSTAAYCLLALTQMNTDGLQGHGVPFADMGGCNIFSNSNASCNGHDMGADFGGAVGTSDCGFVHKGGLPAVTDPYASLAANIPANPCGSLAANFPQESDKKTPLPAANQLGGSYTPTSAPFASPRCGDVQLISDVTVMNGDAVLTIENGVLDLNGHTLRTATGAGLTILFTGPTVAGLNAGHYPTGNGTLNIAAPTSGVWSGAAIYQDPSLPAGSGVNVTYSGNMPTWNLSGLVYLPHADLTLSGVVGKADAGFNCFVLVANTVTINGTAAIYANPVDDCVDGGLAPPTGAGYRMMLVR
jgi:hypothetical protein